MKTISKFLLSFLLLPGAISGYSQYFHGIHSDYSIIGNGAKTIWPYFKVNQFGSIMGGVGTTNPGSLSSTSPMALCIDYNGNTVFNHTFLYSSCSQLTSASSRVLQVVSTAVPYQFHWLNLVSGFHAPNDACNAYTNSHSGVVQMGSQTGGVLFQLITPTSGASMFQKAYVPHSNNIAWWDVQGVEITDIKKAVENNILYMYVVGNFNGNFEQRYNFAFKFDINGNAIWAKIYSIGFGNGYPSIRGIMPSPYNQNDVYLVGDIGYLAGQANNDGFIIKVDANTGVKVTSDIYDIGNIDGFKAINVSDDPNAPGFMLCGYSKTNAGANSKYWVVKTDQNMSIQWNKTYTDINGSFDFCEANAIEGRYSSANSRYEYYVAGKKGYGTQEMMVLKLDESGNPINGGASGGTSPDGAIFTYNYGDGSHAVSIDGSSVSGAAGEGLGIYGYTYNNATAKSNVFAVHAYFNGESGCNQHFYDAAATEESTTPEGIYTGDNDSWMEYHVAHSGIIVNSGSNVCSTATHPDGSNAKPGATTGLNNAALEHAGIELVPNPATDYLGVKNVTDASYTITNSMGQKVRSGHIDAGNSNINVREFIPGVYFITIIEKEQKTQLKFVKE